MPPGILESKRKKNEQPEEVRLRNKPNGKRHEKPKQRNPEPEAEKAGAKTKPQTVARRTQGKELGNTRMCPRRRVRPPQPRRYSKAVKEQAQCRT